MKKYTYFEVPTQVAYFDYDNQDNPKYVGGIGYKDRIICGCCGGIIDISDINEFTPEEYEPIMVYDNWIDIDDSICGGERPTILDAED